MIKGMTITVAKIVGIEEAFLIVDGKLDVNHVSSWGDEHYDVKGVRVPKPKHMPGDLIHVLKNKSFLHPGYIEELKYSLEPEVEEQTQKAWRLGVQACVVDITTDEDGDEEESFPEPEEIGIRLNGLNLWSDESNVPTKYNVLYYCVLEGRVNENLSDLYITPIQRTICDECGAIRCSYANCHICGNGNGIPKWVVMFTSEDPVKKWVLQYDEFAKGTIRRKTKDFIRKNRLSIVSARTHPYNGIYLLTPETINKTYHEVSFEAAKCKAAMTSLTIGTEEQS